MRLSNKRGIRLFMSDAGNNGEVSLERLERALAVAAYIVVRHGKVYAPIFDRLQREVEAARRDDPVVRARQVLAAYTEEGGRNAIRLSHSSFCSNDGPKP